MFKQVFRLTFITFVWKKYKRIIVSTTVLFMSLWLIGFIHDEYLEFSKLHNDTNLSLSFVLKWFALLSSVTIYLIFNYLGSKKEKKSKKKAHEPVLTENADDPFAEIRSRKKLRSRAEMIIDKDRE